MATSLYDALKEAFIKASMDENGFPRYSAQKYADHDAISLLEWLAEKLVKEYNEHKWEV